MNQVKTDPLDPNFKSTRWMYTWYIYTYKMSNVYVWGLMYLFFVEGVCVTNLRNVLIHGGIFRSSQIKNVLGQYWIVVCKWNHFGFFKSWDFVWIIWEMPLNYVDNVENFHLFSLIMLSSSWDASRYTHCSLCNNILSTWIYYANITFFCDFILYTHFLHLILILYASVYGNK